MNIPATTKKPAIFIATHLKSTRHSIPTYTYYYYKIARLFVFTIRRNERFKVNNITLSKNQVCKHSQTNKVSTQILFSFFLHVILANVYHLLLCCCKRF